MPMKLKKPLTTTAKEVLCALPCWPVTVSVRAMAHDFNGGDVRKMHRLLDRMHVRFGVRMIDSLSRDKGSVCVYRVCWAMHELRAKRFWKQLHSAEEGV